MSEPEAKPPTKFRHEVMISGVGAEPDTAAVAVAEAVRWSADRTIPSIRPLGIRISRDFVTIDGDLIDEVSGKEFMDAMNALGTSIASRVRAKRAELSGPPGKPMLGRPSTLPRSGEDVP